MTSLALPDQSGFIPGHSTSHNIRTFFSALHQIEPKVPTAAIFLDATKAFDSLECPFLFTLLPRLGFSPNFIKLIGLLYTNPTARLRVNGMISEPFSITRGTHQGCPLSPLLFAVAMEPLAATPLFERTNIHGQKPINFDVCGRHHTISQEPR